ncbi:hypothetical protein pb186bvf_005140 [Paramecium bursaria]
MKDIFLLSQASTNNLNESYFFSIINYNIYFQIKKRKIPNIRNKYQFFSGHQFSLLKFNIKKELYNCLMTMLIFILSVCYAQTQTSLNSCANEKKVFKLDIRQRVPSGGTIEQINALALCKEAYQYDYIWLYQLWTPSKYNYNDVNGQPQQANDYRVLENIKEYQIDPQLGSLTNLYKFQQNVKNHCLHIKFLGEFSFYVPKDSYLIQNRTRFLHRPVYISPNIYSDRYDDENFQWAINDQMKTVPYAVPWNYFTQNGFQDMQDIIFRTIITQHKLDGIVFLQPSLGLYQSVLQNYYPNEINEQGMQQYMKDFYENIKLHSMATDLYFMGGEDNSKFKSKLLNYLQIVYNQPTTDDNWINTNYTFSAQDYIEKVDNKSVKAQISNQFSTVVDQTMSPTKNTCVRFNYTNFGGGAAGITLKNKKNISDQQFEERVKGIYVIHSGYTQDIFPMLYSDQYALVDPKRRNASFNFGMQDIIEVQFEPISYLIRYKKLFLENNQQASTYMEQEENYTKIQFMGSSNDRTAVIQIAFPFMWSQLYKHSNFQILGHRHVRLATADSKYYMAQVEPSINQMENNFTLNFYILYLTPGQWIGVGVCDRDRIKFNNHTQTGLQAGLGVYLLFTNGQTWHNKTGDQSTYKSYSQYDLISVTYLKSNQSIQFYKNQTFQTSFALMDNVKNLNFCVTMCGQYSTIYLEY